MRRVGIYCRVSSSSKKQLRSLAAQISGLTRFVVEHSDRPYKISFWRLQDIYVDVAPGSDNNRDQYNRMLDAAAQGHINLILLKQKGEIDDVLESRRKRHGICH